MPDPDLPGTTTTSRPATTAALDGSAAEPPARTRTMRITPIVALIGVIVALGAVGYALLPLRTPVQDCGTAATFIIEGRVDVGVDPNNRPAGLTEADVASNAADPCQERAANRALPAGIVVFVGTLAALVALVVEFFARLRLARRLRKAAWAAASASSPPQPLPPPPTG